MRLAALFSDNVVLQRDCLIPVWGWAEPGESVTVELAGRSAQAMAGADGRWQAMLPAMPAGGPHALVARGGRTLTVRNVLVGEVWICSGQSNMEWPLAQSEGAAQALTEADDPGLRLFSVPRRTAMAPVADVDARWSESSRASAGSFSAVAYFFGRELRRRLNVPVGLVNATWGGTPAEAWTSREGLAVEPALGGYVAEVERLSNASSSEAAAEYQDAWRAFLAKLPQDAGNRGLAEGWAGVDHDDSAWGQMTMPAHWSAAGHPTNGVFWFRLAVDVPAAWAGRPLRLALGAIDKNDDTYFNGRHVGGMTWAENPESWCTSRAYAIPAGLAKAGRNVIAVRVLSNYTGGGMVGPGNLMELSAPDLADAAPIPLAGAWRYRIEQDFGKVTGIAEPKRPEGSQTPTMLYNAMIAPLIPFAMRGAIWYQGESNASDAARYRTLFPALIRDWRGRWGLGDFAFHFVQLANYGDQAVTRESDDSRWAELRETQTAARDSLPQVGMAVTIDIGNPADIHPRNKRDVGLRLALCAMAQTYGQRAECFGPRYRSFVAKGREFRVEFDHAEGLTSHGPAAGGFALAGADRVFHPADARIEGAQVALTSPKVAAPVAARYGWADAPVCTLLNAAGLPAEPFRTDDWPVGPASAPAR